MLIIKHLMYLLIFVVFVICSENAVFANKRVALVIGNGAYTDATPLRNPQNDATDISDKLRELDFDVVLGVDLNLDNMLSTIKSFARNLSDVDTAMIFFAGHAVQVNGENYLAPIDTELHSETDLPFDTIPLSRIMGIVQSKAKTLLVFLDACRDNPLARRFVRTTRNFSTRGLAAPKNSSEGTFIAFATEPGNVALDGTGRNSPFTTALLKHIGKPGEDIASLMTDVRGEVFRSTNSQQLPWTNSGLLGRFYFKEGINSDLTIDEVSKQQKILVDFEKERREWVKVQKTKNTEVITEFLRQYPNGAYSEVAKFKREQLNQAARLAEERQKLEEAKRLALLPKSSLDSSGETNSSLIQIETAQPENISKELVRSVQTELKRLGCQPGAIDGLWGAKGKRALTEFLKRSGRKIASVQPNSSLLQILKGEKSRVCHLVCGVKFTAVGGECKLKKCDAGQKLSSRGKCITPQKLSSTKTSTRKKTRTKVRRRTTATNCFVFNGKRICE